MTARDELATALAGRYAQGSRAERGRTLDKFAALTAPPLVDAMERHGHLRLAPEARAGWLAMSAATIDRALDKVRGAATGRLRRRTPSSAIRRSVAVGTFDEWGNPPPGFVEADLVAHSGPT